MQFSTFFNLGLLHNVLQRSCSAVGFLSEWFFPSSAARSVVESSPSWLSPTGKSSTILVLQGEELLLECIAAGV